MQYESDATVGNQLVKSITYTTIIDGIIIHIEMLIYSDLAYESLKNEFEFFVKNINFENCKGYPGNYNTALSEEKRQQLEPALEDYIVSLSQEQKKSPSIDKALERGFNGLLIGFAGAGLTALFALFKKFRRKNVQSLQESLVEDQSAEPISDEEFDKQLEESAKKNATQNSYYSKLDKVVKYSWIPFVCLIGVLLVLWMLSNL